MPYPRVVVNRIPERGEKADGWIAYEPYPVSPAWDMHEAFEIVVVLSGHHDRYFQDVELNMGPGDVALSAGWEPHGWRTTAPQTELLVAFFVPEFLGDERLGNVSWLSLFVAAPGDRPRVQTQEARAQVLAIAADLKQGIERKDEVWLVLLRLDVLRLLFVLARQWEPLAAGGGHQPAHPSNLARIAPAISLVHSRGGRPVRAEEAAAACYLSGSRFSLIFRQTMGVTFAKYVLRSRLAYAARLLVNGDDSLDAIAAELEFTDRSHLHHAFTKYYGCTPGQYRVRR